MAKLENGEICIILHALKYLVREELKLDPDKIFPKMIPDDKKQKVVDDLEKLWRNDDDCLSYLRNIYLKIASDFEASSN